jgi:tRNA nucleotidyltransferase (CCA-adding enzyme)
LLLDAARSIDSGAVATAAAARGRRGPEIGGEILRARAEAVAQAMGQGVDARGPGA